MAAMARFGAVVAGRGPELSGGGGMAGGEGQEGGVGEDCGGTGEQGTDPAEDAIQYRASSEPAPITPIETGTARPYARPNTSRGSIRCRPATTIRMAASPRFSCAPEATHQGAAPA
jgi:hypothetical protein